MSQVLSEQSVAVESFVSLLRAYTQATRRLNAQLTADHGLTISDYEVLLRLSRAPERRMRRVDLAEQVLLTASGITRLLDGLERCGYVERGILRLGPSRRLRGADGRRTREAARRIREPRRTDRGVLHVPVRRAELTELNALLGRVEPDLAVDCSAPE